jgi:hypothetical protein
VFRLISLSFSIFGCFILNVSPSFCLSSKITVVISFYVGGMSSGFSSPFLRLKITTFCLLLSLQLFGGK